MADRDIRVIARPRAESALRCFGALAFCAIDLWLIKERPGRDVVLSWAVLIVFGLVGMLWVLQLVKPSRLVLDCDGLTCRHLFGTSRRSWAKIEVIRVAQVTRRVTLIAKPGGRNLKLGIAWPMSADELAHVIEDYKSRFSGRGAI